MIPRNPATIIGAGFAVGLLGGLIGLGGAEFRLPLLIGLFSLDALPAVIINKAISLVVVAFSLPFRTTSVPLAEVLARWDVIVTLLAGSLAGAWVGAGWATRLKSATLHRILAVLLLGIAVVLLFGHEPAVPSCGISGIATVVSGVVAGFGIGTVAALMGVAGGELLIPTIMLLFGVDIKLAGSLSLAVSLPTMLAAFTRYSQDRSFAILRREWAFVLLLAGGSIVGAFTGSRLLGYIPSRLLLPILALILVLAAGKVWRHATHARAD